MNIKKIITTVGATLALSIGGPAVIADAAVVSSNGAAAETVGYCDGYSIVLNYDNYGFDYTKIWQYVDGQGWFQGSWNPTYNGGGTSVAPSSQTGWSALYVQYADWNGYQWEIGGEWVNFGGTYWCYA